jgi:SAM-dependent methyltransferase
MTSDHLAAHVAAAPLERRAILRFVERAAQAAAPGSKVLDAGAGDAPYRELFAHADYVTTDWQASPHAGARQADVVASLDRLPLEDAAFEHVVCTQVLEHVPDPRAVLGELARVLAPGGHLWLTAPFVGELHEEPHDYFRFTSHGLRRLVEDAGIDVIEIEPLTGYFTTLAHTARNCGLATGVSAGAGLRRRALAGALRVVAAVLPRLDALDTRRALPLGWALVGRRRPPGQARASTSS